MSAQPPMIGCVSLIDGRVRVCPSHPDSTVNYALLDSRPWMAVASSGFELNTMLTLKKLYRWIRGSETVLHLQILDINQIC